MSVADAVVNDAGAAEIDAGLAGGLNTDLACLKDRSGENGEEPAAFEMGVFVDDVILVDAEDAGKFSAVVVGADITPAGVGTGVEVGIFFSS